MPPIRRYWVPSLPQSANMVQGLILAMGIVLGVIVTTIIFNLDADCPVSSANTNSTQPTCAPALASPESLADDYDMVENDANENQTSQLNSTTEFILDSEDAENGTERNISEFTNSDSLLGLTSTSAPSTLTAPPPTGYRIPTFDHSYHPCSKFEFFVQPEEIGLNHIIAPERLDLGYCAGVCAFPLMGDATNHTMHGYFIDQFKLHETALYLPKSCCVPIAFKDTMVLVDDSKGGFLKTKLAEASVTHCGCR